MTVIAGATNGVVAVLGADSSAVDDCSINWPATDKLLRLPVPGSVSRALMGFAGNGRMKGAMRDQLTLPEVSRPWDPDRWARDAARAVQALAAEASPPITDEDGVFDAVGMLAFRGYLWRLAGDTAIPVPRAGAVGAGGEVALGALRALDMTRPRMSLTERVRIAVTIACEEHALCGLPVDVADAPDAPISR